MLQIKNKFTWFPPNLNFFRRYLFNVPNPLMKLWKSQQKQTKFLPLEQLFFLDIIIDLNLPPPLLVRKKLSQTLIQKLKLHQFDSFVVLTVDNLKFFQMFCFISYSIWSYFVVFRFVTIIKAITIIIIVRRQSNLKSNSQSISICFYLFI